MRGGRNNFNGKQNPIFEMLIKLFLSHQIAAVATVVVTETSTMITTVSATTATRAVVRITANRIVRVIVMVIERNEDTITTAVVNEVLTIVVEAAALVSSRSEEQVKAWLDFLLKVSKPIYCHLQVIIKIFSSRTGRWSP